MKDLGFKINGVNLGNWLVLEKWMSPKLFDGTNADDEYYLAHDLPKDVYEARIKIHRSEYITERDFAKIKSIGLNSIRIPVPYFIFGDRPPFIGCIEELDKAFAWANKYELSILIDLHTAPLSQNGFDNGGICGVCKWSQSPEEVEFVLELLEKLAKRYGKNSALLGIQPINEPATEELWNTMKVNERYPARDKELAEGTAPNSIEFIRKFYLDAYDRVMPHLDDNKYFVIHDAFMLQSWKDFMREEKYNNVILDTHQYLMMAEMYGCEQSLDGYIKYINEVIAKEMYEMQEHFPVICGEWCLFNSLACGCDTKGGQTVLNGMDDAKTETLSLDEKQKLYSTLADAQLKVWNNCSGHYYWNYKLLLDTVKDNGWVGWDAWDLGKSHDLKWFPTLTDK